MDNMLIPEIRMEVDEAGAQPAETSENGACIELNDDDDEEVHVNAELQYAYRVNVVETEDSLDEVPVKDIASDQGNTSDVDKEVPDVIPFPKGEDVTSKDLPDIVEILDEDLENHKEGFEVNELQNGDELLGDETEKIPCEQQNGEIISVSPDLNELPSVPLSEQNGDIIDLDAEDSNDPTDQTSAEVDQDPLTAAEETSEECIDQDLVAVSCETIIKEQTTFSADFIDANSSDEPPKSVKKSKKELVAGQIPNDYTPEELEVYHTMFGPGNQAVQFLRLHCTGCNTHLGSAPNKQYKRFIHPLLRVLICRQCFQFYGSGEFDKDEDGSELYCRWCGQGGKVLCCAKCQYVFCQKCIKVNMGKAKLQEVFDTDWLCFGCVPSQTIKLRVIVRALYDFVMSEKNIAAELSQPERLKVDNSLCCQNRQKPTKSKTKKPLVVKPKRANSNSLDGDVMNKEVGFPKKKKIKLKTLSSLLTANDTPENNVQPFVDTIAVVAAKVWDSQDEDEVVCTPDLSLLMPLSDDFEESPETPPIPDGQPPPLAPIEPHSNQRPSSDIQFVAPTQPVNTFLPVKPPPKQLGYKLPKNPLVLNATTNRPLLSKTVTGSLPKSKPNIMNTPIRYSGPVPPMFPITHQNRNNIVKVPSKIIPGTKYDWFEKASQYTSRVNQNLSSRLVSLASEQSTVSSLEGLATIHNNLQEILNNSIKSLTHIRKNLRNDFIAGLKTLKYDTQETLHQAPPQPVSANDDNDVIIIDSPAPIIKPFLPGTPGTMGRLKLKPVSQLVDNAVITIPDDIFIEPIKRKIVEALKHDIIMPPIEPVAPVEEILSEPVTEVQGASAPSPEPSPAPLTEATTPTEAIGESLNPETMNLIRRALQESKFETIVNENLKILASSDIHIDLIKRMLTIRVIVENKFGPATPRIRPRPGFTPMNIRKEDEDDIEHMLSSSIVLNVSKRKVFNDSNIGQNESLLTVSDKVEHLTNGVL